MRNIQKLVASNTAVVLLFAVLALLSPQNINLLAAICFPALLTINLLFLRRRLRRIGAPDEEEQAVARSGQFSTYACSAIFFAGTLGGLLMIMQGELPRTVLPLLLIPLSVAIYCLRIARGSGTRRPS
jgi:hypothetical protein